MYYAYWLGDPGTGPSPCKRVIGRAMFIGRARTVCQAKQGHDLRVSVSARYMADTSAWVEVALVTTRERLQKDLRAFRAMTASFAPCRVYDEQSRSSFGEGQPCPAEGRFF